MKVPNCAPNDGRTEPSLEGNPLVIVEGFLGLAEAALWGSFENHLNDEGLAKDNRRRIMFSRVGPASSLHDRACELFYSLLGGAVDYGEAHAQEHKHSRYGRVFPGTYPEWSASRPLHFLGHSMGAPTIVKMHDLIKKGFFGNHDPDMVLSITSISGPFRGTQVVYSLGESVDSAPKVRLLSFGTILSRVVHITAYLSPLLPEALDLHADSRALSFKESSFLSFLKHLWKSDWAEGTDATPYDCSFKAADTRDRNGEGIPHANTFYRSYVAQMTRKGQATNYHTTTTLQKLTDPFGFLAGLMGSFDFTSLRPRPSFLKHFVPEGGLGIDQDKLLAEEYWANDGVVPVFSQAHPLDCCQTKCRHLKHAVSLDDTEPLQPGIWEVHYIDNANHTSLVPAWTGSARQKVFWRQTGRRLKQIDIQNLSKGDN